MMRCVFLLLMGLAFLPPALAGEAAEAPRRLVATELCADQWLLQLAEPHEIAALSYQAALPALSVYAAEAQAFARHDGSAEAILALSPSLVLAGAWTSPRLLRALERLGVPSLRLAPAERLAQWPQTVRMLAAELRTPPSRVAALLARVPPEEEVRPPPEEGVRPRAMIYHAGGYSSGGGTLAHDMVEAAGAEHLGAQLGAAGGWVHAPLERLLADAPQLLILDAPHATQARQRNLAKLALEHGALRRLMAQTAVYRMSEPAWLCLTPQSFLATEALARAVRQLAAQLEAQP